MAPVRVKFLRSPTGAFGLAYSAGQEATIPSELASTLIGAGYAEALGAVEEEAPARAAAVEQATDPRAENREAATGQGQRRRARKKKG